MRRRRSISILAVILVTVFSIVAVEYVEYPFAPHTLSASSVNSITGKDWIRGAISSTSQWHSTFPNRITQTWYAKNQTSADSILLTIVQTSNHSNAIHVFKNWFAYGTGTPPIYNVTQEGSVYYNYTIIYINLSAPYPLFSEIRAFYGNDFVLLQTDSFFTFNRSVMLNLLNAQVNLISQSSQFLPNY